jgi:hypothetical protein
MLAAVQLIDEADLITFINESPSLRNTILMSHHHKAMQVSFGLEDNNLNHSLQVLRQSSNWASLNYSNLL